MNPYALVRITLLVFLMGLAPVNANSAFLRDLPLLALDTLGPVSGGGYGFRFKANESVSYDLIIRGGAFELSRTPPPNIYTLQFKAEQVGRADCKKVLEYLRDVGPTNRLSLSKPELELLRILPEIWDGKDVGISINSVLTKEALIRSSDSVRHSAKINSINIDYSAGDGVSMEVYLDPLDVIKFRMSPDGSLGLVSGNGDPQVVSVMGDKGFLNALLDKANNSDTSVRDKALKIFSQFVGK